MPDDADDDAQDGPVTCTRCGMPNRIHWRDFEAHGGVPHCMRCGRKLKLKRHEREARDRVLRAED